MRLSRSLGRMQLLHELVAHCAAEHGHGPSGQAHAEVVTDLDLEVAAVEVDRDSALGAAEQGRDRRPARARARGHGLPHPALEDAGGDLRLAVAAPEGHVRAVREELDVALDRRAELREVELLERRAVTLADLDRALRVADRDVLEAELAAGGGQGA